MKEALNYDFETIEERWQERWRAERCFEVDPLGQRPTFYNFVGGPFPNGSLHMGHVRTYVLGDAMARFQRLRGKEVLTSFEFDAFGLPTELEAQRSGQAPELLVRRNVAAMRSDMKRMGLGYDWRYVHTTCEPKYYRWTQWLFLELHEHDLVYRAPAMLSWCPSCETSLAQMQISQGRCWRCGTLVSRREEVEWFVRLSKYGAELLDTFDGLSGWSRPARRRLEEFIGRCRGFTADFPVAGSDGLRVRAFASTRRDLARATELLVARGHPILAAILAREKLERIDAESSEREDLALTKVFRSSRSLRRPVERYGIDTGRKAIHPTTGAALPIRVSAAVDPGFATGVEVSLDSSGTGVEVEIGEPATFYRMHDWQLSRQRSWGTPIPILHCPECGVVPVPREMLPVELDASDFRRGADRRAERSAPCARCNGEARRDRGTVDCYFDVVWCYLACANRLGPDFAFRAEDFSPWMPVDWFHNGLDSAIYALLYRFLGRALDDLGIVPFREPITRYHGHEVVLVRSRKMGKSEGNAVSPREFVDRYGADVLRLHVLWRAGPLHAVEWSDELVWRSVELLNELWSFVDERAERVRAAPARAPAPRGAAARSLQKLLWRTSSSTAAFLESYRPNACIEALRRYLRELRRHAEKLDRSGGADGDEASADEELAAAFAECVRFLILAFSPLAPHVCEELWSRIGGERMLAQSQWPEPAPPPRGRSRSRG